MCQKIGYVFLSFKNLIPAAEYPGVGACTCRGAGEPGVAAENAALTLLARKWSEGGRPAARIHQWQRGSLPVGLNTSAP